MCLLMDNTCHRKRNDYKIDMAIDTFWHESICLFLYKDRRLRRCYKILCKGQKIVEWVAVFIE